MSIKDIRYNRELSCWECDWIREDTIQDLYEALARTGLYYPYHINVGYEGHTEPEYTECHEHSFERLLTDLSRQWDNGFSIKGYEEYYSKQEIKMIEDILRAYKAETIEILKKVRFKYDDEIREGWIAGKFTIGDASTRVLLVMDNKEVAEACAKGEDWLRVPKSCCEYAITFEDIVEVIEE